MIRQAKLCKNCTTKCCEEGTDTEPLEIECPLCRGVGCQHCAEGFFRINGCPNKYCSNLIDAINIIDLFEKGLPPVAGGVLDQSASFINAAKFFHSEEQLAKAESNE